MSPEPYMLPSGRLANAEGLPIADDPRQITLVASLKFLVPLWIHEIRNLTDEQRVARANRYGRIVAERGDVLQFGGGKKGQATEVFNALAEGLACAAYQPGGITVAGLHWCTDHRACLDAEAAAEDAELPEPTVPTQRTVDDVSFNGAGQEAL